MISPKLRDALSAFAMLVIVGGPVLGALMLIFGLVLDNSGTAFGRALMNVAPMVFSSILTGGMLRVLTSIDARLEARA